MSINVIKCPHCRAQIVPMVDGICPACRRNTNAAPTIDEARDDVVDTNELAWEKYQESLRSRPAQPAVTAQPEGTARPFIQPTPVQRVVDFERALVSFTPRLIATPALVVANVVVFLAMVAMGVDFLAPTTQDLKNWGGNFAPKTMNGEWWRLVSAMFLHAGLLHLGFNMLGLWSLGKLVERLVGNVGFVVLYFVSGIAGSMASLVWHPLSVCVGASGAVFGIAGGLLGLIAFRHDTVPAPVLKQLRTSMAMFLIYNVYFSLSVKGVDLAAHIGGLVAGALCGLILSQPLSIDMVARRPLRNTALVVIGVIGLALVALALPAAPVDVERELQRFSEIEKRVLQTDTALVARLESGRISRAEFADQLERDVLAPWIEGHRILKRVVESRNANEVFWNKLEAYVKCREESWKLQVEALRQNDEKKLEQANLKSKAADQLLRDLSAQ